MPDTSVHDRIWNGDSATVGEARIAYLNEPSDDNLMWYAMVLYSFRDISVCAGQLSALHERLIALGEVWTVPSGDPDAIRQALDRADCLSTYLLWVSRQEHLPPEAREAARTSAYDVAMRAQAVPEVAVHTRKLLQLTAVEARLDEGDALSASILLAEIKHPCGAVGDQNQRARIMRKWGYLRRRINWSRGSLTILHSAILPGITARTSLKSLAALCGIRA